MESLSVSGIKTENRDLEDRVARMYAGLESSYAVLFKKIKSTMNFVCMEKVESTLRNQKSILDVQIS